MDEGCRGGEERERGTERERAEIAQRAKAETSALLFLDVKPMLYWLGTN